MVSTEMFVVIITEPDENI